MLDFDSAQSRLSTSGRPPAITETCPLHLARGRVLAQTLFATLDLPPADNSAMDGYAIRHADFAAGNPLPVQQRCYAGDQPQPLKPGHTIRLFTGSLVPEGADTIVMQEDGVESDDQFEISSSPILGAHIRHKGEDVREGDQLLPKGTLLAAAEIALLASQGYAQITVYAPLKVGILTTGDELVTPGQPRADEHVFNSNGPMLGALTESMGATVVHVLHARDTQESLQEAFALLLRDCDLILTVGGVSVGEKDLVKPAIEQLGGVLDMWRVSMKPGKPVALAHIDGKPVVCLPGNPVSAYAVFTLLVTPLLRTMQGRAQVMPPIQYGTLVSGRTFGDKRDDFLRVQAACGPQGVATLTPYPQQGSGIISSLPWATALARIPANTTVNDGDTVAYYDLARWLA
jgi:molybdopterin molybdotransferase